MHSLGIKTGADLKNWSKEKLVRAFGKSGHYYYAIARGIDNRPVITHRIRKSLGSETTFPVDIIDVEEMKQQLFMLADEVIASLQKKQLAAHCLTIKVKYADFQQVTRSITVDDAMHELAELKNLIPVLLGRTEAEQRPVRLLGVTLSGLTKEIVSPQFVQPGLFDDL